MKQKGVLAMLALLLAITLAGCSGNKPSGKDVSGTKEVDGPKPITITMLGPGNASTDRKDFNTEIFPELVKEKFPHVTVVSELLPQDQFITTLKARMSTGEGPDIFFYWPKMQSLEVIKPGFAKDLSELALLDKFNPSVVDAFAVGGAKYAIPSGVNILGVYYNKDLFRQAGIEETPQDWAAFLEACRKLQEAGIQPIVSGDKDAYVIQFGLYQLAASMVYPTIPDLDEQMVAGEASFADSPWVDVLTRYKELYDAGYVQKNSLGAGNTQAQQMFIDGKAAMTIDGNWANANVMQQGAADFERGFFPLPGNDAGQPLALSAAPSGGTFVNAKTENYDTIVSILEYMYEEGSPLFEAWVSYNDGQIPTYNGLAFNGSELYQNFYSLFQTNPSYAFSNQGWPAGVVDELVAKYQELITGAATVEDVLQAADLKMAELSKKVTN
ncbi:ABC transporter substrate-binding protein [Paenibacillus sp. 598K]|uniref:ABC transporter substrate-binding protein n=1 Tax=Paenibacillus sp. 598K TaxID=1117987 RepID=UPI00162481FB|nr:extracellular solute-binding protein [Paenibacillus sp. 598K]